MAVDATVAQTNTRIRTVARVAGVVLTVAGIALFLWCGKHVLAAFNDDSFDAPNPVGWMFGTVGSFALFAIGMQCLNLGFLRAQADYVAGEASGAVRSVGGDIAAGLGRDRTGPYCSACGVRNDAGAHFCDACGKPLATG